MDDLDHALIQVLQRNARLPFTQIAKELNQPDTTIHFRTRRLVRNGIITRFSALIDPNAVGLETYALLTIRIGGHIIPELSMDRTRTFAKEMASKSHYHWIAISSEPMTIYALVLASNSNDLKVKVETLRKSPDVTDVAVTMLDSMIKGWELTGSPIQRDEQ